MRRAQGCFYRWTGEKRLSGNKEIDQPVLRVYDERREGERWRTGGKERDEEMTEDERRGRVRGEERGKEKWERKDG